MKFINHLYRGSFSRYTNFELEDRIMKKKLDINKVDINMFTPLSYLADQYEYTMVFNLIEKKFDLIDWEIIDEILSFKPILTAINYANISNEDKLTVIQKINAIYPLNKIKIDSEYVDSLARNYMREMQSFSLELFKDLLSSSYIEKLNKYYEKEKRSFHKSTIFNSALYALNQALNKQEFNIANCCVNVVNVLIENNFNLCFSQEKEKLSYRDNQEYNTLFSDKLYWDSIIYLIEHLNFKNDSGAKFLEYWFNFKANNRQLGSFNVQLEKMNEKFYIDALNKNYQLNESQIDQATLMIIKNTMDLNLLSPYYEQYKERMQKMFSLYGYKDNFNIWQEAIHLNNTLSNKESNKKIKI